jgi:hypothetical protein
MTHGISGLDYRYESDIHKRAQAALSLLKKEEFSLAIDEAIRVIVLQGMLIQDLQRELNNIGGPDDD